MAGRIDVHAHLLFGVDDGCPNLAESLSCARLLLDSGYTHAFCTPHLWPNHKHLTVDSVRAFTIELQTELDRAHVPLKLIPGGELNLAAQLPQMDRRQVIPAGIDGKYVLADLWAEKLPDWFDASIRYLQSLGLTVILAHPERMRAVQERPELTDHFAGLGVLLQGNLQCFADRLDSHTRRTAERLLKEGRYFLLGSDLHNVEGLKTRLIGLNNAIQAVGQAAVDQLTRENPKLLAPAFFAGE